VRGRVEGEETCEISGVGPVPVRVARDLLGDAVLHLVVTKSRDVASVTYLGRGMTAAQRIAAAWAQPECQRLGCHRPVMEWDHRVPWAERAETRVGNMQGLCRPDHRLKSEHGWELVDGDGKRPMVPPTDPRHPANTRRGPPAPGPPARQPVAAV
jgi:hypothetical protein